MCKGDTAQLNEISADLGDKWGKGVDWQMVDCGPRAACRGHLLSLPIGSYHYRRFADWWLIVWTLVVPRWLV